MTATDFASYQYDAAGRIIGITQRLWAMGGPRSELYPMQLSWTAGYDSRDRLTSFNRDGAQTSYSYDPNSNRLTALDKVTSDADLDGLFEPSDQTRTTSQALRIDEASNRLLGFTQTLTTTRNGTVTSVAKLPVNYTLDANGAITSDGLREFTFDAARRMSKVTLVKNGEAASVNYLTNAMGQRVFKSVVQAGHSAPDEQKLGRDFTSWLRQAFGWLFSSRDARGAGLGTAYVYGDGQIPEWAMLGEYDNGTAEGRGNTEYIWLPTEDGSAIPVGLYRNGQFYAVHTDHLGTPRLVTDGLKKPVWQWPYSAFGNNEPIGVLIDARNADRAPTKKPVLPRASEPIEMNLRFPGQYADAEAGVFQNWHREYSARTGRYVQSDPIGLIGGISRFAYVGGNPLSEIDPLGLASSGQTVGVPGGNGTTVRIDRPHVPGQQTHAHICEKGCKEIVVNKDGTGSHGTDPRKLKNRVKNFLRNNGFKLSFCPPLIYDTVMSVAADRCAAGDLGACRIFQQMGGTIHPFMD